MPIPFTDLAGLILAAGESRRLGQPKQLVPYQGQAMICSAIDTAANYCGAGLIAVTGANAADIEAAIAAKPVSVARNAEWQQGMATSLRVGVASLANHEFAAVLIMLCDQPHVSSADIARLVAAWQAVPDKPAAACYNAGLGVPAIFPTAYLDQLLRLEGDKGARAMLQEIADVSSCMMPSASFDVDTVADLNAMQDK